MLVGYKTSIKDRLRLLFMNPKNWNLHVVTAQFCGEDNSVLVYCRYYCYWNSRGKRKVISEHGGYTGRYRTSKNHPLYRNMLRLWELGHDDYLSRMYKHFTDDCKKLFELSTGRKAVEKKDNVVYLFNDN